MIATCTQCGKPIVDTEIFGTLENPLCWQHYAEMNAQDGAPYYGLAPHHHVINGSITTVFEKLPEPNENGDYDCGDSVFVPDPECPGCGVWIPKAMVGWR